MMVGLECVPCELSANPTPLSPSLALRWLPRPLVKHLGHRSQFERTPPRAGALCRRLSLRPHAFLLAQPALRAAGARVHGSHQHVSRRTACAVTCQRSLGPLCSVLVCLTWFEHFSKRECFEKKFLFVSSSSSSSRRRRRHRHHHYYYHHHHLCIY